MGKKVVRLFQPEHSRNIRELEVLEYRRHLRQKVNELIRLANNSTIPTEEMQRKLTLGVARFGTQLSSQLLRSLHREDSQERQSIVWLLILLNEKVTVAPLQHISQDKRIPRSIRLSASLALAGLGATLETIEYHRRTRLYAIS
jgi:phosphoenolpyruvate carboxylase